MGKIGTSEFRAGLKIEVDGQPYVMVFNQFVKPGKGQAFNRTKLKHLRTGRVIDKTFRSNETVDEADVVETKLQLLYTDGTDAVFMDDKTYEQMNIPLSKLEDVKRWLLENLIYDVVLYKGEPVTVEPPTFIELKVTETEPGAKGDTASGRVLKSAIVETGAKVQVPLFVNEGDVVRFDTRTGDYVSRVNK